MQWEFRKILESIQAYRTGSPRFIAQIEKGSPGTLNTIVREIQLIISDPNAKIINKVLAMRFARDIMILGRQDVINQLGKIVPHMLKVCSFKMESDDPNRGEAFFHDHPQYSNASPTEKQDIQRFGSTYFTLNLQSIYHWAKWIPADEYGNESIFSKALNTLLERGVKFNNTYNYYKNSDTQKFKNTYRVQFFSEQSGDFDSSLHSSRAISDKGSQNSYQSKQLQNVERILNSLYALQSSNGKRFDKLQRLNKNAINLLQKKYSPNMVYYGKQKSEKRWLQNLIVNYNLLSDNKITYEQFMKRSTSQTVQIPQKTFFNLPNQQLSDQGGFKKQKTSAKRQILGKSSVEQKETYENLMRKQQQSFRQQKQTLRYDIVELNNKIQQLKFQHDSEKNEIIKNYQDRIKLLKQELAKGNIARNEPLILQNQKLKDKLSDLERSFKASRAKEAQVENLAAAYDLLKVQNLNLRKNANNINQNSHSKQNTQLLEKIKLLERDLSNCRQEMQGNYLQEEQANKKNKQIKNLNDELLIYKNSLKSERQEFERKLKHIQSRLDQSQEQNRNLKQKNKALQKKLDLKDIQSVELNEQVKLLASLGKEDQRLYQTRMNENKNNRFDQKSQKTQNQPMILTSQKIQGTRPERPLIEYNYKKYEKLRNQHFRDDKERFLRYCRCCLKKKDLLLKQNELQIGLISEVLSNNQIKYIIHLTNTSQQQINEIRLFCELVNPNQQQAALETQYIFCLQPNEQQKVNLFCRSPSFFSAQVYDPLFVIINYTQIKLGRPHQVKAAIPFILFKTIQMYKVDKQILPDPTNQVTLTFPYSHKMIGEPKHLYSYFPALQQTMKNKYECDLLHRETGSRFRLSIAMKEDGKLGFSLTPLESPSISSRGQKTLEQDLMGFFQFCFRR